MVREKVTYQEPLAHPASRRVRLVEQVRRHFGLSDALAGLLKAVLDGHRGPVLRENLGSHTMDELESEFEARVNTTVYVAAAKVSFAAATDTPLDFLDGSSNPIAMLEEVN